MTLTVAGVAFGAAAHMLGRIGGIHIPGVGEVVGFGEAVAAIGTGRGMLRAVGGIGEGVRKRFERSASVSGAGALMHILVQRVPSAESMGLSRHHSAGTTF